MKRIAVPIGVAVLSLSTATAAASPLVTRASTAVASATAIFPMPQSVQVRPERITIPVEVGLLGARTADPSAVAAVRRTLAAAGARVVRGRRTSLTVSVGSDGTDLSALRVAGADRLPPGGYVVAVGRGADGAARMVLDGVDRAGQYYAAQTLRQLVVGRTVEGIVVRDWPSFRQRGVVEGFYGPPWSRADRLSALDFLAAHKLNLYMYGPKDDAYLRSRWDVPFPAPYRRMLRELAARAQADHVTLNLVVSPGLSICYSSADDHNRLLRKLRDAWSLGVRSFTIALDDIDVDSVRCASDAAYGTGPAAVAKAQATLVNAVARRFIATHTGAARLITVPTEYNGIEATPYIDAFAATLDHDVIVQWTGRYGVSVALSEANAAAARRIYMHSVLVWDNYYVTDYAPGFLALGPLTRHDASLANLLHGVAADPMVQAQASRIGLFTLADYTWNSRRYNAVRSWNASIREFAADDAQSATALRNIADANWGSQLNPVQAPALAATTASFWTSWDRGETSAATRLDARLRALEKAPAVLRARLRNQRFVNEIAPWLDATQVWAQAARVALSALVAQRAGNRDRAAAIDATLPDLTSRARSFTVLGTPVQVAPSVLDRFVADCRAAVAAPSG